MTIEQLWNEYSDLTTETMLWWQFEKAVDKLQSENERAWNALKRYMTEVAKCNKGFRRLNRKSSDLKAENEALKKQMESQKLYAELGRLVYQHSYDKDNSEFYYFSPRYFENEVKISGLINQIQESEK